MCVGRGGRRLAAAASRRRFSIWEGSPSPPALAARGRWWSGSCRSPPASVAARIGGGGVRSASGLAPGRCGVARGWRSRRPSGGRACWRRRRAHRRFCQQAAAGVGSGQLRALALVRLAPAGAGGGWLLAMACGRRPPLAVLSGGCGRQRWPDVWCQLMRRAAAVVGGEVGLAADVAGGRLLALTPGRLLACLVAAGGFWRRSVAVWLPSAARRRRWLRVAAGDGEGTALAVGSSGARLLTLVRGVALGIVVGARRVLLGVDMASASGVGGCRLPALAGGWRLLATLAPGGCWHGRGGGARRRLCR